MLTTRVARELGYAHRALASAICYPVHYSEAVDLLRPARVEGLRQRIAESLFVHLWSAMLNHRGVDQAMLPPDGSMMRAWADKHPVDGWKGEYDAETLENSLRPDTEARMRIAVDLVAGIEELARAKALQREMSIALREENAALQAEWDAAAFGAKHLKAERDAYAAIGEIRGAEAEALRNSRSWKLTAPLRRARNWLRGGRPEGAPKT